MAVLGRNGTKQLEIRDCFAVIFTETCLHHNIPDKAAGLDGRTVFRTTGQLEVDSVFTSMMLGAQTQCMDTVNLTTNSECEDATVYIHPDAVQNYMFL